MRATSGPSVRIEARIVRTSSYGASAPLILSAWMIMRGGRKFGRFNDRAHVREQASHRDDVAHARNVVEFHAVGGQQRRGHRRQRGILRAADAHRSFERPSAFDQKFIHVGLCRAALPSCFMAWLSAIVETCAVAIAAKGVSPHARLRLSLT